MTIEDVSGLECAAFEPLLAARALAELADDEARSLDLHLSACDACREVGASVSSFVPELLLVSTLGRSARDRVPEAGSVGARTERFELSDASLVRRRSFGADARGAARAPAAWPRSARVVAIAGGAFVTGAALASIVAFLVARGGGGSSPGASAERAEPPAMVSVMPPMHGQAGPCPGPDSASPATIAPSAPPPVSASPAPHLPSTARSVDPLDPWSRPRPRDPLIERGSGLAPTDGGSGTLVVACTPFCDVVVDGAPRGTSPLRLSIAAGSHRITATHGRSRREMAVVVEPGKTAMLRIDLDDSDPFDRRR